MRIENNDVLLTQCIYLYITNLNKSSVVVSILYMHNALLERMCTLSHFSLLMHVRTVQYSTVQQDFRSRCLKTLIRSCYAGGKQWFFDVRLRLLINMVAYEYATTTS